MLKVTRDEIGRELDSYLQRALVQPVSIEAAGQDALVVLSMLEYERLQQVDEAHWAACARRANVEGYLDHEQEERGRLAAAMLARQREREQQSH